MKARKDFGSLVELAASNRRSADISCARGRENHAWLCAILPFIFSVYYNIANSFEPKILV